MSENRDWHHNTNGREKKKEIAKKGKKPIKTIKHLREVYSDLESREDLYSFGRDYNLDGFSSDDIS